ncbi:MULTISPECIES: hypothetical protein [Vitreoscilla]|uniref:Uncharacterized protein n=1 Tax=Vitreoscilla stercoraria TaxID=61 RepID=A0ABY4E8M3_VITST|nr:MULTISPECIES: hypothetical protein [Vitreoscilla]AUZ03970.1 hypothetical protein ADP71_01370 [Vitreoscilla sp. C1]UOO92109.1 hypothetical protein LVJ81_10830 [Vitreoscilla stercoraria]
MLENIKRLSEKSKLDTQLQEARQVRSRAVQSVLETYLEHQKRVLMQALNQHGFEVVVFENQRVIKAEIGSLMLRFQLPDLGTRYLGALSVLELSVHNGTRRKEFKIFIKLNQTEQKNNVPILVKDQDANMVMDAIAAYRDLSHVKEENLVSQLFEIPILAATPLGVDNWDKLTDVALSKC